MVILVYTEDDKDVFFMGKFNDNYHWDGYCITNVYYKDGTFNDSTGNAWDISYSEKEEVYIYNKGIFKNNYATDTVESEPVDLNRINKIIDGKKYDCELKWR